MSVFQEVPALPRNPWSEVDHVNPRAAAVC